MSRITDLVPVDLLEILQEAYQNYLQTSAAIYELDGSYAACLITSKYCNCLTDACEAKAGQGKGICHDDCWQISKKSIDLKKPFGEECSGGLFIYSVPIMLDGIPIGAANAAVSNPPKDIKTIKEIAEKYGISVKQVQSAIDKYEERPEYVRESAKKQIEITARTIASLYKAFYELREKEKNLTGEITGRKQTEEKLRAMSKVFMDATDPIFVENLDGKIINVNAEAERAYGWTREELLGRPIDIIIPPEAQKRQLELRPLCLQGKDVRSVECLRHSKSGKMFNVLLTLSLLSDEAGKPAAIATIAKDITALKQVEKELKVRVHQQAVISEVGLRSLSGIDLSTLMDEVVIRVARTLDVEYCKVLELLPDGKTMLLKAGVGWKEGYVGHATVGTGKDSQAGYTLLSDKPVIVEDFGTEKRFKGAPLLLDHGVVSGMSTIIQDSKRPFGILGAHTTIRRTFTRDDINFLQAIANVLAEAVTRKQAEEELRAMSKVFMDATDPIFIEDLDRKIIDVNAEAERAYGWTREELLGRPIDIVIPPEAQKRQLELRPLCLQGKDVRSVECLRHSKSGKMFNVLLTLSLLSDEAGKPAAIATIAKDITARKQAEKTIEHMAYHDHLTGLPNRKLFSDRLTKAIAHAKRYKQKLAIMFLDLDNFKDVNDALGHSMGDELLKAVGERLKGSLREEDTVARLGGDEFILLLPEIADKESVATVAQKILMLIGKPLTINNNKLDITTSIGVALYPDDTEEAETLVRYADAALYRAKGQGRDNFQFHTPKK